MAFRLFDFLKQVIIGCRMAKSDRRKQDGRKRMSPSIDALKTFVATADAVGEQGRTMEAVAKSLELVPLGIKNHLKNLEEECGFSLFDEDGDLLKLSPQAASHLWVANRILNLHERFKMLNPLSRSRVRIAVPNGTLCTILPEFVRETIAPVPRARRGRPSGSTSERCSRTASPDCFAGGTTWWSEASP